MLVLDRDRGAKGAAPRRASQSFPDDDAPLSLPQPRTAACSPPSHSSALSPHATRRTDTATSSPPAPSLDFDPSHLSRHQQPTAPLPRPHAMRLIHQLHAVSPCAPLSPRTAAPSLSGRATSEDAQLSAAAALPSCSGSSQTAQQRSRAQSYSLRCARLPQRRCVGPSSA